MKKLLLILIALSSCKQRDLTKEIFTMHHEGLCFVVYRASERGVGLVQVDCAALTTGKVLEDGR